jgi:hypothetical protein
MASLFLHPSQQQQEQKVNQPEYQKQPSGQLVAGNGCRRPMPYL